MHILCCSSNTQQRKKCLGDRKRRPSMQCFAGERRLLSQNAATIFRWDVGAGIWRRGSGCDTAMPSQLIGSAKENWLTVRSAKLYILRAIFFEAVFKR